MTEVLAPQVLRCFVAVARQGSVSRAAAELHLSQPAVSLQIRNLEEVTRLRLFERSSHGLELTAAGRALLSRAEAVLDAAAGFNRAAGSLRGAEREVLRVGTILDPEFTCLGSFLKELVERAPRIEAQLRHGMSDDVLAQVVRRDLDVGFYLDLPSNPVPRVPAAREQRAKPPELEVMPLKRFSYRVAAPPGWGPRVRGKGWRALGKLPWLATPPASAHRRFLAAIFGPLGIDLQRTGMTDEETSMLDLLESGAGLSLVRDSLVSEARARKLVIVERLHIDCVMSFIRLAARREEAPIAQAWRAMERAFGAPQTR